MSENAEPLRPAAFHVLLALSQGPLHGLGIADAVEEATGGSVLLGPGTLYRSLKDMTAGGLIDEDTPPAGADPRRRYYRLTPGGRSRLAEEVSLMARVVEVARERAVIPNAG